MVLAECLQSAKVQGPSVMQVKAHICTQKKLVPKLPSVLLTAVPLTSCCKRPLTPTSNQEAATAAKVPACQPGISFPNTCSGQLNALYKVADQLNALLNAPRNNRKSRDVRLLAKGLGISWSFRGHPSVFQW